MAGPNDVDGTTVDAPAARPASSQDGIGCLLVTIVHHRDLSRVGWRRVVHPGETIALSRLEPLFTDPREGRNAPLGDPRISRQPAQLRFGARGGAELETEEGRLTVDGQPLEGARVIEDEALQRGVVLDVGGHALLLVQRTDADDVEPRPGLGLVGESPALQRVRQQIERIAAHRVPVLLLGETGTGKELVARAIHDQSERGEATFISVNLAAIPSTTAAAALFGHKKGAFTGAVEEGVGYFGAADTGTLFLDEVGEASPELQAALLRVLESGEVQPVGASTPSRVDVRLVAATDADLDRAVGEGKFRLPLMMRLGGYELRIPPLRRRRDDIARLLVHFIREELEELGRSDRIEGESSWLPAPLMVGALRHPWPGNVRQLRNVARRLVIDEIDREVARGDETLRAFMEWSDDDPSVLAEGAGARRSLDGVSDEELVAALRAHDFRPGPAARTLGISRTSIYALIDRSDAVRKAGDLTQDEIAIALERQDGDVPRTARALAVSERGLRLRMQQLGMTPPGA